MNKKLKKILLWSTSIIGLLFLILVVHLYIVTKASNKNEDKRNRQLARIDFKQEIDSLEGLKIRSFVAHMDGVEGTYFNDKDNILVYAFYPAKQKSTVVYDELIKMGNYKASRFTVDAKTASMGCPVMDKSSMSYKASSWIQNLFK